MAHRIDQHFLEPELQGGKLLSALDRFQQYLHQGRQLQRRWGDEISPAHQHRRLVWTGFNLARRRAQPKIDRAQWAILQLGRQATQEAGMAQQGIH